MSDEYRMTCPTCNNGELLFEPFDYENGDPVTPYYESSYAMAFIEEARDCACTFTEAEITELEGAAYDGWEERIIKAQSGMY